MPSNILAITYLARQTNQISFVQFAANIVNIFVQFALNSVKLGGLVEIDLVFIFQCRFEAFFVVNKK